MTDIVEGLAKAVLGLIIALFIIWALSKAPGPPLEIVPSPAGAEISIYSTWQDAAEVSGIILGIVLMVTGMVGMAISREARAMILAIIGLIVFVVFLILNM